MQILIFKRFSLHSDRKTENRNIWHITFGFVAVFVVMIFYLGFFAYFKAPDFINSSYNSRQELFAKRVVRGKILSRDERVLAETEVFEDGSEKRVYPYKNLFAHAVGYSDKGKSGAELLGNFNLLTSDSFILDRISNTLNGRKNTGDNIVTTLDVDMQAAAYKALGNYRGAIIALDVRTGEILCMVSKPDFDPNRIAEIWDEINTDNESGYLVNRATQGLYPPGSTFKIVTMLEYLRENSGEKLSRFSFDCHGSFSIDQYTINCYHGNEHGEVDLETAFSKSCNSAFASIGVSLSRKKFRELCEELLFNEELPLRFPYKQSFVPINEDSDIGERMQTAIGQGKMQASPIHIAMITGAIANKGILMEPYLIDRVENGTGDIMKQYEPSEYGRIIDEEYAQKLTGFMKLVVEEGTATRLKNERYTAAGKTGSAEFSSNKAMSHAWFTGFAPAENPRVAVTVIAEEAGSGGQFAVPMAKEVFDAYFD
ncbi:MAG: penicillin-binding protein 2 [Lachnospiraceae bacterium]|nr:penicillin-binding protein 2 [Lachnospiraceae bacterium]